MPRQPFTKKHGLGDGPIQQEYRELMNSVASGLDQIFNGDKHGKDRQTGFVLLVFPFNDHGGRCNYISNGADRADIVCLMKEQIARFEGRVSDVEGNA